MWDILLERLTHVTVFGFVFVVSVAGGVLQTISTIYADSDISGTRWEMIAATAIGQMILFLTYIVGLWWQNKKEVRNREWDLADRETARQKLEKTVEATVVQQKQHIEKGREIIVSKIEENTEISTKAFATANDVNKKIEDLTRQFLEVKAVATGVAGGVNEAARTLDRVEDKTTEAVDLLKEHQ